MKLIVGLGNPGREYIDTRHNIGFTVIDALSKKYGIRLKSESGLYSLVAKGKIEGNDVVLAKPLTFMNLSGVAVKALIKRYKLDLMDLLVVCDDMDLELGRQKIRPQGSSAGQKGTGSVIEYLETDEFTRLRIGIGRPGGNIDPSRYVLAPFNKKEKQIVQEVVEKACDCCLAWLVQGTEKAMNVFNVKEL